MTEGQHLAQLDAARQELRKAESSSQSFGLDGDSWLARSYQQPPALPLLLRAVAADTAPCKSDAAHGFDFFHDLVLRHRSPAREVFRCYTGQGGFLSLTLGALRQRSARLAAAWTASGVKPGQRLALILPVTDEYVVALVTALRLGLVVCPMPPRGPLLLQQRLAVLAPDFVYTTSRFAWSLRRIPDVAEKLLVDEPVGLVDDSAHGSYTYAPGAPALVLFSPLGASAEQPQEVTSEVLYRRLLIDVLLTLGLEPGQMMAAPGSCPEQYQPCLLLLALLGGWVFAELPCDALRADIRLLSEVPITHLLLNRTLVELLSAAPRGLLPRLACLWRDPLEAISHSSILRMLDVQGLGKTPVGNMVMDSSAGGALLFSPRQRGKVTQEVLPAAGQPYVLGAIDDKKKRVLGSSGVFQPASVPSGFILLARSGGSYFLGGTVQPRVDGRLYPEAAARKAVLDLPFVDDAVLTLVQRDDGTGGYFTVLVVTCGAEEAPDFEAAQQERILQLQERLRSQLDDDHVPDRIELFPVLARRTKGAANLAALRREYLCGDLHRKSRDPLLRGLYQLIKTMRGLYAMKTGTPSHD